VATVRRSFGPTWFVQTSANAFLGHELTGNESISIVVEEGSALVYGADTDNRSQDPTMQMAQP
jgi:hypothetical protein